MATRPSRRRAGRGRLIDRLWIPGRAGLKAIEGHVREHYGVEFVSGSLFDERYVWRARVTVPGFGLAHSLRIELEAFGVSVVVENWTGDRLKHTFGGNRLCMWCPSDPAEKQWQTEDGLLKLLDTAVQHLFKEYYVRETGEWLGEEAPHAPKAEERSDRVGRASAA